MDKEDIQVLVGYIRPGHDCTQIVSFTGERLGEHHYTQHDNYSGRSVASIARLTQTLYRPAPGELSYVGDGIFVVHTAIEAAMRDATTSRVYWLEEVNERDLLPSGGFEELGRACGFRQHLSLQEGLVLSRERYRTLSLGEMGGASEPGGMDGSATGTTGGEQRRQPTRRRRDTLTKVAMVDYLIGHGWGKTQACKAVPFCPRSYNDYKGMSDMQALLREEAESLEKEGFDAFLQSAPRAQMQEWTDLYNRFLRWPDSVH